MVRWKRLAIVVPVAFVALLLALLVPFIPFYQPIVALVLFVALCRWLKVGSFVATVIFALLLAGLPIVMFSAIAAPKLEIHAHEAFYWSIVSISELPAVSAYFLLPIAIALSTYAGRRWLYP